MKVFRSIEELDKIKGSVVTIGSFDGLHKGHTEILSELLRLAKKKKTKSTVITFHPHPRIALNKDTNKLKLITTLEEKIDIFSRQNIDNLVIIDFTKQFASLDYEDFVTEYLVRYLSIKGMVIGYNHLFGKDRKGNFDLLLNLGEKYNFEVSKVNCFSIDENSISSTEIRKIVESGAISKANKYLIEPYFIMGDIIECVMTIKDRTKLFPCSGLYSAKVYFPDGSEGYLKDIYVSRHNTIAFHSNMCEVENARVELLECL